MKKKFLKLGGCGDAIASQEPSLPAFIHGKQAALPEFERRGRLEQINSPWTIATAYFDLSMDIRQQKRIRHGILGKTAIQFSGDIFRARQFAGLG